MEKVQIVLDADVLIHFAKANLLSLLPDIFPEYGCVVLSVVYEETASIRRQLDNQIARMKNITVLPFEPRGEMKAEYARLRSRYGKGESACMAFCRFTHNVIGSSNLNDIKTYCKEQRITYLTTLDFLYYAYTRGKLTKGECRNFIEEVNRRGSRLPRIDIERYTPNTDL